VSFVASLEDRHVSMIDPATSDEVPMMETPPGPVVRIDGRSYRYFGGTSYYGLHGHAEVIAAGCEAFRRYGLHTATSRAGFGHSEPLLEVEQRAAEQAGRAAGFYFSSGYAANHILVQAVGRVDAVFIDESAHFCVAEAARLPGCPIFRFQARDVDHLRELFALHLPPGGVPLVMTDGVVPATGHLAPLDHYVGLLRDHAPAVLLVDDAHGLGVFGASGKGSLEHFGLQDRANGGGGAEGVAVMSGATLGKAMGGFGGIITGSADFIRHVRACSHYHDGASAPPTPVAAASAKSLELIAAEPGFQARLLANSRLLRDGLRALGLAVHDAPSAHVGVAAGDAANMARLHRGLREAGLLVPVSSYVGTGPEGLLRFAVCSAHTAEMIDELLFSLRELL
jgi:7-keto-8-aminopelargonate synthetase-like enzyme